MNQKEAVFLAVRDLKRGEVDTDTPIVLNKQEKAVVHQKLFDGFKKGRVAYNHELPSDDKLMLYISGLVSNWLRKDKRLNGQRNYVPGRPGARSNVPNVTNASLAGIDPAQLEALRALAAGRSNEQGATIIVIPAANTND